MSEITMNPVDEYGRIERQLERDPERPLTLMQRRRFLQGALAFGGTAAALPTVFAEQAAAQTTNDTILVTVTLGGGNDGLNTLGPFSNGRYQDLRGQLAIAPSAGHSIGNNLLFHPNLRRLATRYRRGDVAVVRGVGEPLKDRSHFSNLARWQSANPNGAITGTGWIGRWLDAASSSQFTGIAIGGQGVPLHFRGRSLRSPTFHDTAVRCTDRTAAKSVINACTERSVRWASLRTAARGSTTWAQSMRNRSTLLRLVAPAFKAELPEDQLLSDMVLAARVINLNLGTRALNVWQNGYDTHDNQIAGHSGVGDHADLLAELDVALDTFFNSLSAAMAERVVVMVYSEFGRRAEANGSKGTDHGTSSHVFLVGRRIKGGLYGDAPPLNQLDDRGDFRVTKDFRDVYATVLEQGLETSASGILGQGYSQVASAFLPAQQPESALARRAREIRDRRESNPNDYLILHTPTF